jgi:hypothetical protein
MRRVREDISHAGYAEAFTRYKKEVRDTESVNELLNLGLLAIEAERYEEGQNYLAEAERLAEERFTRSLSREAVAVVMSDLVRAYEGTDFDKGMLHYYRALAFLAVGHPQSAVVEGRRIAQYLTVLSSESGATYRDDAFLQYFNGTLYELGGQVNDAWISYRRAREVYRDYYGILEPSFLCPVTLSAARAVGIPEEEQNLEEECPEDSSRLLNRAGRVIVLCEVGQALPIEEENILIPIFDNDPDNWWMVPDRDRLVEELCWRANHSYDSHGVRYFIRMALPVYSEYPCASRVAEVVVRTPDGEYRAELVQDIEAIFRQDLKDRYDAILARAVTRAILRCAAAEGARKAEEENRSKNGKSNIFWGILGAIFHRRPDVTVGPADTRSWETLPEVIFAADFQLPPGVHPMSVVFYDDLAHPLYRRDYDPIPVRKGDVLILRVRYTG